jgi:TRAP-type C4-dicarboxylate transport system permease small subunit
MNRIFAATKTLSQYMYWISGVALACLMLLTVSDVVLRIFNRPITGVYDLTMMLGGVIIGLAIPLSTWKGSHVYMGFFIEAVPPKWRKAVLPVTHGLGIFLFLLLGWRLMMYGIRLYQQGEVSLTIHIPLYPVVFSVGISCLLSSLVVLEQLLAVFAKEEKA